MSDKPLHYKALLEVSAAIRRRETSAHDVTSAMLARIETLDGGLHSYIHLCADRALQQAEAADAEIAAGLWRGPLHGVPLAVKDLCQTRFAPTRAGTVIYKDFMAPYNATVVDRLEMAGAVTLGKISMTEGAYTGHHPTIPVPINPWNTAYWVGTSSSGSGVAPAAGLTFAALGSDTGGSIRYPCATCGLTGIKPTYGRVSRHGIFPLAGTMDHVGPMARSVADCAAVLQAIAGWDAADPTSLDLPVPDYLAETGRGVRDMRIGIDRDYAFRDVSAEVARALEDALAVFESLGARIVEVRLPPYDELVASWIMMCAVETAVAHAATYPACKADYGPDLALLIEEGRATSGMAVARGNQLRVAFSIAFETLFGGIDCMLCPTMPTPTPRLDQMTDYGADPAVLNAIMRYTAPYDFSGSPTVTLPNGFDAAGMPLSMQIVGPKLGEGAIIRAGHAFQSVTDWHARHPRIDQ